MNNLFPRSSFRLFFRLLRATGVGFICLSRAFSQPADLYFHHLNSTHGLSQSTSNSIYRDRSGFVWIGSAEGLNRFDGVQVKVYKASPDDSTQLADPTVISPIFEDRRGDLWFCTHTAVHRYRRQYDDFQQFKLKDSVTQALLKGYQVFCLDQDENLWVHCNGVLYRIDTRPSAIEPSGRFQELLKITGVDFRFFEQKQEGSKGILYSITGNVIQRFIYTGKTLERSGELPSLTFQTRIQDIYQEINGTIWVAAGAHLLRLIPGNTTPENVDLQHVRSDIIFQKIQPWQEQNIFLSSNKGLFLFDKSKKQIIRHWGADVANDHGLSSENLSTVHIDYDHNLWVSSWTKGIDYTNLHKLKFQTQKFYSKDRKGTQSLFVPGPILEDRHKTLWLASQMQGLLAYHPDTDRYEDFSDLAQAPDQLFGLENGSLLINNFGSGIRLLFPENRKTVRLKRAQKEVIRYHLCQVSANIFLMASGVMQQGLLKLVVRGDEYTFEPFGSEAVSKKEWYYVTSQSVNEFLIADDNYNLFYFRDGPGAVLKEIVSLPGYINCSFDHEKATWLGGSFGLCIVNRTDRTHRFITVNDGLPDNMVYAILRLTDEDWWLSTGKGLVKFNPLTMQFRQFGLADGLQALEFNRRSCLLASDGTVWFGGVGGYNRFRPANVRPLEIQPKVQVVDIQVNDGAWPYQDNPILRKTLRLPYDSATLAFHFVALEYSDPAGNRLKYRLDYADGTSYDQEWVHCADARGFARYANLPPGVYVFRIMGANSDGVWSTIPKEISIEITPPFYQTWWFRLLVAGTLLLASFLVYRSRLIAMRKKEEQKRRMIELELNALRAQLNPHFVSNMLTSINHYIRNSGVEKVRSYVATFARLMRNVLESARTPVVSLQDELHMLQSYVEVESGRFPQPIDFSIYAEPDVHQEQLFLPGMLLQPFIENAILHGLAPRAGQGKIELRIRRERNVLIFTIENDGLGPAPPVTASRERKSHGLDITRERLQLYDQQHSTISSVKMEHVQKKDGTFTGTRILLYLGLPSQT